MPVMVVKTSRIAREAFGKGQLAEDVRHLAQQAGPAQAVLGGRPQQHAVQAADVAVLQDFQFEAFQLRQAFLDRLPRRRPGSGAPGASGWPWPRT